MKKTDPSEHWAHSLPLEAWASCFGTPFYLYHLPTLRAQCARLREAFGEETTLLYAVKANPNPTLLEIMREESLVDGLDIASMGELEVACNKGWQPSQMSYAGPGKRPEDITHALTTGVGTFCAESLREIELFLQAEKPAHTRLMTRINPACAFHAYGMKTSGGPSPFGIDEEQLPQLCKLLRKPQVQERFLGLHLHVGSQCFSAKAFARMAKYALNLTEQLRMSGIKVSALNLGGGFGVSTWKPPRMLDVHSTAKQLKRLLRNLTDKLEIRIEPGRYITGPSGIYISRIQHHKHSRGEDFLLVDGGMHHYLTATEARFQPKPKDWWIENLSNPHHSWMRYQITGPLCTPRDQLGVDVELPKSTPGDLLGWPNAGSYGLHASPMWFLGHPTPKELLFDGESLHCIRRSFQLTEWLHAR